MSRKSKSYSKNVEGDFYVEDGCCLACMVPEYYTPDLIVFDKTDGHCFVAKQPVTDDELYRMIKTVRSADLECVRYAGSDRKILTRLAEAGAADSCDEQSKVYAIKPLLRNHVIFRSPEIKSARDLARKFKDYLLNQNTEYVRYQFTRTAVYESGVSFSFSWYQDNFYTIWFSRRETENFWHIHHSPELELIGSQSVSLMIDEWLGTNQDFSDVRWFSNKSWNESVSEWQATPI